MIEREYAEQVANLEGAIADEVKVVYTCVEPLVDGVNIVGESVSVKGKLKMSAIIKTEDQLEVNAEKVIPFEENIEFEDVKEDMILTPKLSVTSLKASVNPKEDGCEVVICGIVELCVVGEHNEQVELLLDGFLKDHNTENTYKEFGFTSFVEQASAKGIHNAEIERKDLEADEIREIILVKATPKIERVEYNDGIINIFGELKYSGVASVINANEISYIGIKNASPFATNVNINCQNNENLILDSRVFASEASATLDANKVYLSCILESLVTVCEEQKESVLSSMELTDGEEIESCSAKITVYYPGKEDTLFSVAKRFHSSGLKIARDNDISESVFASSNPEGKLSGIKKLVIY